METSFINNGPMLNAYPDSMGGTLADIVRILKKPELAHVFQSFYIFQVFSIRIRTEVFL